MGSTPRNPDDDEGPPTRPTSDSYAVYRDEAIRVASQLDDVILISRRPDLYDTLRVTLATAYAARLRGLATRFERWPSLPAAVVAEERHKLAPELIELLRACVAVLRSMPTAGPLGKVKQIR